jgi:hypothetical protein
VTLGYLGISVAAIAAALLGVAVSWGLVDMPWPLVADRRASREEGARALRVLFIGNSYSAGVAELLSALPGVRMESVSRVKGGATLEQHWEEGVAVKDM